MRNWKNILLGKFEVIRRDYDVGIEDLLEEGWEPFAVTTYTHQDNGSQCDTIYFKRFKS